MKSVFEPIAKTNKDASDYVPETSTETSEKNIKAPVNLNNQLLAILKDIGKLASFLLSLLSLALS